MKKKTTNFNYLKNINMKCKQNLYSIQLLGYWIRTTKKQTGCYAVDVLLNTRKHFIGIIE